MYSHESTRTTELRSLAPTEHELGIYQALEYVCLSSPFHFASSRSPNPSPIISAYNAALSFASHPTFQHHLVTRAEYLESGSAACNRKFKDWKSGERVDGGGDGKGKGRAREDEMDWEEDEVEEVEEVEVVVAKKGTKGKGRAGVGVGGQKKT